MDISGELEKMWETGHPVKEGSTVPPGVPYMYRSETVGSVVVYPQGREGALAACAGFEYRVFGPLRPENGTWHRLARDYVGAWALKGDRAYVSDEGNLVVVNGVGMEVVFRPGDTWPELVPEDVFVARMVEEAILDSDGVLREDVIVKKIVGRD